MRELLKVFAMPGMSWRQKVSVWYFTVSLCALCVTDGSPLWVVAVIVLNFANAARVIKAYIGKFNTALEEECGMLEVEPEITPYMLANEIDEINMWLAANGNKPLVSQKASVKGANLTQDTGKDFEQIQEESGREGSFVIGEPVTDA